jgi:hypothetical protein
MPKAAVHKDGELDSWKHEIRLAKHRLVPTPSFDFVPTKEFYQRHFRGFVALPANPRHQFRTLRFAEDVAHGLNSKGEKARIIWRTFIGSFG